MSKAAAPETCENCRFWVDENLNGEGECHRYAPRPMSYISTDAFTVLAEQKAEYRKALRIMSDAQQDAFSRTTAWPITTNEEWCGEFIAKEPSP